MSTPSTTNQTSNWYSTWFDSPYYHQLYAKRDEGEAHLFIDALLGQLQPKSNVNILDLACGKGRFSRYLAQKGFSNIIGLDLSERSITEARKFEQANLSFYTHDMRLPYRINYFDYIFNFFTSLGYFETEEDEIRTLQSITRGLRPDGTFVLDFFNAQYVIDHLTGFEKKEIDGITFHIHKFIRGNQIIKTIDFTDRGKDYHFEEQVRLFFYEDFERLFAAAGLELQVSFGNYQLDSFQKMKSPRLILLAKRI